MKTQLRSSRVVIIGTGAVGATTAYTLLLRERISELVLIDANKEKALGEALDMNHGLPFTGGVKLWAGDYSDCADADIIVIAAGASQRPGETRIDLLKRNAGIFDSIIQNIVKYNNHGIILVATNPVDILAYVTLKKSGFPSNRVIGSGTLLDSARFRYLIGQNKKINPRSIHAHIIGEHGDSEVPLWSLANVAGIGLEFNEQEREEIFNSTKNAAYEIINAKGATSYAIALALDRIIVSILQNEGSVLNVSTLLTDYNGVSDVYLGAPSIVDRTGVRQVLDLQLGDAELTQFQASANKLKSEIAKLEL
ncbi:MULTISPECIES: L-lactate dehydrogenase [Paenibacillus]|uniref:L-lactate dehydrogenase n=1 Tax=Paenibacillus macerans TaxID=44252 RepID=A0A090ZDR8_PAEMA|nr:L-lactate dehydrogenase [Paenibacillus macerans]KFN08787.1 L-lactate dehydrogenase [Paenibacillus macerans]MBS5914912.1 L-lactate dehydrogenase [Paenibacillus macerans]MCY7560083.1 L-lactate dehydrogenase [Paenibacillus macerans]MDU5947148.1 L-lactate dehydrogenase [Paenibacillus macerans]MEC0150455.1 L-lactate dehydrogenase [Paenibacillus macerans]